VSFKERILLPLEKGKKWIAPTVRGFADGGRRAAKDKATEKIVRAIYEAIAKEQVSVDWSWVKREAESQLAGKSPSGRVGMSIQEGLKKAGKL
jgi:hypothetical protein